MESEMKEFEGTTYQEWLDYHQKISYREIVKAMLENCSHWMSYGKIGKEKD